MKNGIKRRIVSLLCVLVLCIPNIAVTAAQSSDTWTIRDVYMTDGWVSANREGLADNSMLSGSSFSTMVSFPKNGSLNLWIGTGVNQGFVFSGRTENNQSYLLFQYIVDGKGNEAKINQKFYSSTAGVDLFENENLKLTLKIEDNTSGGRRAYVYFNDTLYGSYACKDATELIRNVIVSNVGSQKIYLAVPEDTTIETVKEREPASYNLSDGDYLLTGKNPTVNGEKKEAGDVLNQPGDYRIREVDSDTAYEQNVSLYKIGDVNLDGNPGTIDDVNALQEYLKQHGSTETLVTAAEYAADLNNDNAVNRTDLELMEDIAGKTIRLDAVLEKYYPPALSFNYLGGDEVMPVLGYYGPYKDANVNTISDEVFRLLKESGVNVITAAVNDMGSNANPTALKLMELADKYQIGYYMKDWSLNQEVLGKPGTTLTDKEVAESISRYSFYGNYLGATLMDEPWPNKNPIKGDGTEKTPSDETFRLCYYDDCSSQINKFANLDAYMTLYPSTLWIDKEWKTAYPEYLEDAITNASLKVLCYDEYPCINANTGVKNAVKYMRSLDMVRYVSQNAQIPFWGYVQAGELNRGVTVSNAEICWNVNTLLAFGAKGIGWYPIVQPYSSSVDKEGNRDYKSNALIGANSQKTDVYDVAKKMNTYISGVDEVLMKAKSTGVIVTGGYAKKNMSSCSYSEIRAEDMNTLKTVQTNDTTYGAIVGCFEYGDMEAFYVVNNNVEAAQQISLQFDGCFQYRCLQGTTDTTATGESVTLTIPAGEAVLIVMEGKAGCVVTPYTVSAYQALKGSLPSKNGYVFAGWYTKEACGVENAMLEVPASGNVYAKFVDEAVLTAKMQVQFGTNLDSQSTKVRLITTVDSLDYEEVGFDIRAKGKTMSVVTRTVYESLLGYTDTLQKSYTADVFAPASKYFMTCNLTDIPGVDFNETITVTPKWKTLDGVVVTGVSRSFCVKDMFQGSYGSGYEQYMDAATYQNEMTVGQYGTGCSGSVELVTDEKFGKVYGLNVNSPEKSTGTNDYLFRLKTTGTINAKYLFFYIYNPTDASVPININTLNTDGSNYQNLLAWKYLQPGWNRIEISKDVILRQLLNGVIPEAGKTLKGQWKITGLYVFSDNLISYKVGEVTGKMEKVPEAAQLEMPKDGYYMDDIHWAKTCYDELPGIVRQGIAQTVVDKMNACLKKTEGYGFVLRAKTDKACMQIGQYGNGCRGELTVGTDAEYGPVLKMNITGPKAKEGIYLFTAKTSLATDAKHMFFYLYNPTKTSICMNFNTVTSGENNWRNLLSWKTISPGWNRIELHSESGFAQLIEGVFCGDTEYDVTGTWMVSSFYSATEDVMSSWTVSKRIQALPENMQLISATKEKPITEIDDGIYIERIRETKKLYDGLSDDRKAEITAEEKAKLDGCLEKIANISTVVDANGNGLVDYAYGWPTAKGTVSAGKTDATYGSVFEVKIADTKVEEEVGLFSIQSTTLGTAMQKDIFFYIYNPTKYAKSLTVCAHNAGDVVFQWKTVNPGWNRVELKAGYTCTESMNVFLPGTDQDVNGTWKVSSFYAVSDSTN